MFDFHIVSGIIVDNKVKEEGEEGSRKDEMENGDSDNNSDNYSDDSDSYSDIEEEEERSSKWTDRALMMQSGLMTAIQVEEERRGNAIQRIRAR